MEGISIQATLKLVRIRGRYLSHCYNLQQEFRNGYNQTCFLNKWLIYLGFHHNLKLGAEVMIYFT